MSYSYDTTFNNLVTQIIPKIDYNVKNFDFFLNGLRTILLQHEPNKKHSSVYKYLRYDITFIPVEKRESVFNTFILIKPFVLVVVMLSALY